MAAMIESALVKEDSNIFDAVQKNDDTMKKKDIKMNMDIAKKNGKDIRMAMNPMKNTSDIMRNGKDIRTMNDYIKNDDINNVKITKNIQERRDYDFKNKETSRKRLSESSPFQNTLDAKKLKIQQALSTSHRPVEKKNNVVHGELL